MKKFTQVKKVINGTEYVAQFNGFSSVFRAIDSTYIDGTAITSMAKFVDYLLENVLVSPKKTVDDFESREELDSVISYLSEVNNGYFREETDKAGAEAKS